jgi:hypothetical protein
MNTEIRVRLEGQLEIIETSIAALRRGAAAVNERAPHGLCEIVAREVSAEMVRAEGALRRLADRETAAGEVLAELAAARGNFWAQVEARGRLIGARQLRPEGLVRQLEDEPLLFWGRVFSWEHYLSAGAVLVMTAILRSLAPLVLLVVVAFLARVMSVQVLVTRRHLRLGADVFELGPESAVHVRRNLFVRSLVVEVVGPGGSKRERGLPAFPLSLERAIARSGARVERTWAGSSSGCSACAARKRAARPALR